MAGPGHFYLVHGGIGDNQLLGKDRQVRFRDTVGI